MLQLARNIIDRSIRAQLSFLSLTHGLVKGQLVPFRCLDGSVWMKAPAMEAAGLVSLTIGHTDPTILPGLFQKASRFPSRLTISGVPDAQPDETDFTHTVLVRSMFLSDSRGKLAGVPESFDDLMACTKRDPLSADWIDIMTSINGQDPDAICRLVRSQFSKTVSDGFVADLSSASIDLIAHQDGEWQDLRLEFPPVANARQFMDQWGKFTKA